MEKTGFQSLSSRTLTGAWIETPSPLLLPSREKSRTHTGAWIETKPQPRIRSQGVGRTLTGAWIETGRNLRAAA